MFTSDAFADASQRAGAKACWAHVDRSETQCHAASRSSDETIGCSVMDFLVTSQPGDEFVAPGRSKLMTP
ncbi:hypothetical protein GCM10023405_16540 [Streptomonospora salina]